MSSLRGFITSSFEFQRSTIAFSASAPPCVPFSSPTKQVDRSVQTSLEVMVNVFVYSRSPSESASRAESNQRHFVVHPITFQHPPAHRTRRPLSFRHTSLRKHDSYHGAYVHLRRPALGSILTPVWTASKSSFVTFPYPDPLLTGLTHHTQKPHLPPLNTSSRQVSGTAP